MKCQWQSFIRLLPQWLRQEVDKQGSQTLQELRLRTGLPPELRMQQGSVILEREVSSDDINFCINAASHYSPWSAQTVSEGYITAPGGHRLGICGDVTVNHGNVTGITNPNAICIRIARDFQGIAAAADDLTGSVLIIGKPGSGKTTLLRDLIRRRSDRGPGSVAVVDEKREIFPKCSGDFCFSTGLRTDVLSGCTKRHGITAALRNLGAETIAVDEITAQEDCQALMQAGWCGVHLIATAHAKSIQDLYSRPIYRPLIDSTLFQSILALQQDKSWTLERICK